MSGKKPSSRKKGNSVPSSRQSRRQDPAWWAMIPERVAFVRIARELDELTKTTYGRDFTISQLKKALGEIRLGYAKRDDVELPVNIYAKFIEYERANDALRAKLVILRASLSGSAANAANHLPDSVDGLFSGDRGLEEESKRKNDQA